MSESDKYQLEYMRLIDAVEDQALLREAENRMAHSGCKTYTQAEVIEHLGITDDDLKDIEVELE